MSPLWIVLVAAAGFTAGPWQRARIFHHAHPGGRPRRHECPHCGKLLIGKGWRGLATTLPPTGRCAQCHQKIGPPAFAVESTTAIVFALFAWHTNQPVLLAALCWLALLGTPLAPRPCR